MFVPSRLSLQRITADGLHKWFVSCLPWGIVGFVGVSKACHTSSTANVSMVSLLRNPGNEVGFFYVCGYNLQIIHIINKNLLFPVSDHPGRFNDKSLETIANCWPNMRHLSVGGPSLSSAGLIHIGKHYQPSCRILAIFFFSFSMSWLLRECLLVYPTH